MCKIKRSISTSKTSKARMMDTARIRPVSERKMAGGKISAWLKVSVLIQLAGKTASGGTMTPPKKPYAASVPAARCNMRSMCCNPSGRI